MEQNYTEKSENIETVIDDASMKDAMQVFQSEQNFALGIGAGALAALVGAGAWALITLATGYQIGFVAIGVGFLVGFAVRLAGKGVDQIYGIAGAVLAMVGCLLGNVFTLVWFVSKNSEMGFLETLDYLTFGEIFGLMVETSGIMDVLFYGIALYYGYKISFRQISSADLERAIDGRPATFGD